jgi:hypothetical protein
MGVCIFSYDGGVTIGLQVDPRLVPDPDTIITAIHEELEALAPREQDHTAPLATAASRTGNR